MSDITIGIDISKAHLDVWRLPERTMRQFPNSPAGFEQIKSWLCGEQVTRIVYEATGPYHGAFEQALTGKQPLVKVNPLQARRFAQAKGARAKTDQIDARLLAQMGQDFQLQPDLQKEESLYHLKELRAARQALVKEATRLTNRLKTQKLELVRQQTRQRLEQVKTHLKELGEDIQKRMNQDLKRARAAQILSSIPGLGEVAVAALLIEMPELGTLARKQVAALAGLAPMARQSGRWKGTAFIQGGRKPVRDALYMPALVASRHNPDLKAQYDKLCQAGKPPKLAVIAVMRKLVELANTLIKADRTWQEKAP